MFSLLSQAEEAPKKEEKPERPKSPGFLAKILAPFKGDKKTEKKVKEKTEKKKVEKKEEGQGLEGEAYSWSVVACRKMEERFRLGQLSLQQRQRQRLLARAGFALVAGVRVPRRVASDRCCLRCRIGSSRFRYDDGSFFFLCVLLRGWRRLLPLLVFGG